MTLPAETVFEIPSNGEELYNVRRKVEEFAKGHGFDEAEIYPIKVAVSEAVANAIEHGSPRGAKNRIAVKLENKGDALIIHITDQGRFKARMPVIGPGGGSRGRGLFLMSALMDEVDIEETDRGTTLRLIKKKRRKEGR